MDRGAAPGLPLSSLPGNPELLPEPQFSHLPNGNSCTSPPDSSEDESWGSGT